MQAINEKDISFNLVHPTKSHFTFYLYTVYSSLVKIFDFTHNNNINNQGGGGL